jgi:hypothetical protein
MDRSSSTHDIAEKRIQLLDGKPERKRTRGKPWRRSVDNITNDLKEIEWEIVVWMHHIQDRDHWRALVNMVINLRVHKSRGI